jgi:hypothetical protein
MGLHGLVQEQLYLFYLYLLHPTIEAYISNLYCSHPVVSSFVLLWPSTQQTFQNKPNLFTLVLFNNCYMFRSIFRTIRKQFH